MLWFTLQKCSRNIYLEVSFLWVIVQSRHEKTQLWDRKIWKSLSFLGRKSDITPEKKNGRQIVEILSCVKIPAHGRTPPDAAFVFGVRCERLDPTSKDAGWATFDSSADLILRAEVQGIAELGSSSLLVLWMVRSLEKDLQNHKHFGDVIEPLHLVSFFSAIPGPKCQGASYQFCREVFPDHATSWQQGQHKKYRRLSPFEWLIYAWLASKLINSLLVTGGHSFTTSNTTTTTTRRRRRRRRTTTTTTCKRMYKR